MVARIPFDPGPIYDLILPDDTSSGAQSVIGVYLQHYWIEPTQEACEWIKYLDHTFYTSKWPPIFETIIPNILHISHR